MYLSKKSNSIVINQIFNWQLNLVICLVLLLNTGCKLETSSVHIPTDKHHYQVNAEIEPATGRIEVETTLHWISEKPKDTLRLMLHRDLGKPMVESKAVAHYYTETVNRFARAFKSDTSFTNRIVLVFNNTIQPGERIKLDFSYEGNLKTGRIRLGGSVITPEWTELQVGALWLPTGESLRDLFTYDANIKLPENYELVGNGTIRHKDDRFYIRSTVPGPDLPIVISDRFQHTQYDEEEGKVTIYHAGTADSVVTFISDHTKWLLNRYDKKFESGRSMEQLRITIPPIRRARPELYARPGFIAMSFGTETDLGTFRLLAHETAHLWWSDAVDTQSPHNFMNESFAEYEAYLSVREEYGKETFDKYIERAKKQSQELPGFDQWNMQLNSPLVRRKGPWVLHQLHERIGDENFLQFERNLQLQNVGTLEKMTEVLAESTDPELAEWFKRKLYSKPQEGKQ